ncbi:MAG: excinuclease ABC subunit UvrA [Oscillospiraceae bacterium]|nr:excinuclease ABC subunit UvrA [Oscillospiraceae bacterium]
MPISKITIRGARENNLRNIDLELPRDKLIVMTGLSGSGKSSLAFDTIYADGQRRYIESLSSYARQFLGQMEKPNVDSIEGLSPAISIDQKTTSRNPRSTVGTVTEIYDYLRLLYARIGIPHCPVCNREIKQQTIDQIVDQILTMPKGTKIQILAPIVRGRKGEYQKELDQIRKQGYVRVRIDGSIYDLSERIRLDKNLKHDIEVVVDRLVIKADIKSRLSESLETAGSLTDGLIHVDKNGEEELRFSQNYACPEHGVSIEALEPRMFSFNNPYGACQKCSGLGTFMRVDPDLIIPNKDLSIKEGAIKASGWTYNEGTIAQMYFDALAKRYKFSLTAPVKKLSQTALNILLYGTNGEQIEVKRSYENGHGVYTTDFEGLVNNLERRYRETGSNYSREEIGLLMSDVLCPSCKGDRLNKEALSVTVANINLSDFCKLSIEDALEFIANSEISARDMLIAEQILKEVKERLGFLKSVGLGYLNLSRAAGTLSGGESQRIRLATQIGSSLMGVLYILDEPSIGLHQRDNDKLIATLKRLRDLGNTLIVVEHDEETMHNADYIVDIGPGAGIHGGEVVCAGTMDDILECEESITGQYLSGKKKIPVPVTRKKPDGRFLEVFGAAENNLKGIDVKIPLGMLTCVTGVSGSGKSSLVNEIIYKYLVGKLNRARSKTGKFERIAGAEHLDKVIDIDQSPIGRTPRSNPATYTGVFTDIRDLYASTNAAKMKGYATGRFSFNVRGGRCEACEGDGIIKIEMHFLPDIYVPCDVCKGQRYNRETLEVMYKGKNIYEVLEMTVEEGITFFENIPRIAKKMQTLFDVGLGYIKIGQSATTLSGGEAQRVKLAAELGKRATGRTIYILDEPTTGLHTADVHKLIEVLQTLVEGGNTVVVIEHNLDIIKTADYIIDLGPEGGGGGGYVIATGTPEELAKCKESFTGQYLKRVLGAKKGKKVKNL